MPVPEFFQTVMGHRFYEGDVPAIRRHLEAINGSLVDLTAAINRLAFTEERRLQADELQRLGQRGRTD